MKIAKQLVVKKGDFNMNYIMLILYSWDLDYIAKPFATEKEAIQEMNRYLNKEIEIIRKENEYEPIVKYNDDTEVILLYTDDEYQSDADKAVYKVIETSHYVN